MPEASPFPHSFSKVVGYTLWWALVTACSPFPGSHGFLSDSLHTLRFTVCCLCLRVLTNACQVCASTVPYRILFCPKNFLCFTHSLLHPQTTGHFVSIVVHFPGWKLENWTHAVCFLFRLVSFQHVQKVALDLFCSLRASFLLLLNNILSNGCATVYPVPYWRTSFLVACWFPWLWIRLL